MGRMKRSKRDLEGRWAVVTGAEGGIGKEICIQLARRGASLVMVGIQDGPLFESAMEIASRWKCEALPLRLDLTENDALRRMEEFLDSRHIVPYILVNNAGIFSFRSVADTSQQKVDCFISLHVKAVTDLTRVFCRRMAEAGEGRVLNMSSMSCWMPMPGIALYSATKAYIRVFSRAMHYEMKDSNVSVTVACPGGIATDLFGLPDNLKRLAVRLRVLDTPEAFARKAVDKMMKGRRQYINGLLNRFSIFFVGVTPTWMRMMVKRKMLDRGIVR